MWSKTRKRLKSSSSAEVDFLKLCTNNVRGIEDLVNGGNLLNQRQCLDLSSKLSKTTLNIRELVLYCGASAVPFRPALENLYRYLEKAKLLVSKCREEDWCAAAVFQSKNENAFREILLDVSLCYNAIYEQAKSNNDDGKVHSEDLRETLVFRPATDSDILEDQQDLQKRLEDLVNEPSSVSLLDWILPGKEAVNQCLAKYLLLKLSCTSEQTEANPLDTCSAILWSKESEVSGTWGNYRLLGAGSGASGVCSTKWMGIPCAKKEFHPQEAESSFLKEAGILAHLKHPCIVNFFCCGNGLKKGDRFIAMELMEMSLSNLIDDQKGVYFSLPVVVDMMVQIARGMCYLHGQGVAHRDLKPQNVVVNRLTYPHVVDHFCVKLVDFEMSKTKVEVSKANTISVRGVGTTMYRAPEVHPKEHPDGKGKAVWFKADIYSFAVTCAHLLSLKSPFADIKLNELYKELKKGRRPELPSDCPQEIIALLKDCWGNNPLSRPSFMDICTRLETFRHEILRGDQEERMDFSTAFDFIKTKVEELSSIQRPLMDNTEDEVEGEHENIRNDVVSVILCTCGRELDLLRQPPYISCSGICNICGEFCDAEVYHCDTCCFDAHLGCVEIEDKVKVFFHDDPLHLLVRYYCKNIPDVVCGFCEESLQESEWVYRCGQCSFDAHALCTKYPKKLKHHLHEHVLTLVRSQLQKSWFCERCNCILKGYYYTCTQGRCACALHPSCAILPVERLCIFDSQHWLSLYTFEKGFHCGKCGALGFSWYYHCKHCDVHIHLDCVDDMEEQEDDWNGAYEKFMLECETIDDRTKMGMILELLDKLFVSDTLEASSSSSSRPPLVTERVQPTIKKLTLTERLGLDAFDDVNLLNKIAAENVERKAKKMAAREARQKLKAESLEMLENLERIVLDLQSSKNTSQADADVLVAKFEKLKKRQDIVREEESMHVLSKMRQGPRIGLFFKWNSDTQSRELLTSLQADTQNMYFVLLCEEPGHEHIARHSYSWPLIGVLAERWERIQPLLAYGLHIVTRAMNALGPLLTKLDFVTIPRFDGIGWDLRAIDLERHSKQSRNPFEADENVDVLKTRAEDSAAERLLHGLEAMGVNIFETFRLWRVRYTVTEEANSPRYTQGALAWLCTDHLNRGVEAGTLESYPLQMYHNLEFDKQRGYDEQHQVL